MKLKKLESENKYKVIILLLLIYLVGVSIYIFLGCFDKNLGFIPDERLYIQAAKAFANGDGLYYNGLKSTFQKVVYSIIISPAYLVKDLHVQVRLVCIIGTLFEMTSVFPIYLISRKLNLSRKNSLLMCLFCLSVPTFVYSMTFMSETVFLPLWLWSIYLIIILLDTDEFQVKVPIILGALGYILYMCKEVGVVAIPVLILTKSIIVINKRGSFKEIIPGFISLASFSIFYLFGRFLLFSGTSSSYSYEMDVPSAPSSSDKNLVYFISFAVLFYFGYLILANNIFPVLIRSNKDSLNHRLTLYIEMALIVLLVVVVYKITLNEDYGIMSPRLHLRYFEPLFIPYLICFIARLNDEKEEYFHRYTKLSFGIFLLIILMLPGPSSDGLLDSTTITPYLIPNKLAYSLFLGSPRKTVIFNMVLKAIIILVSLVELKLLKWNKKVFACVFISVAFALNVCGVCLKAVDIRRGYHVSKSDMEEMQEINDELSKLSGQKLMIARENMLLSEIMVTFYDIKDTDIYLAGGDYDLNDETVTLKAANASKEVNIADYDYIVYEINLWEESEDNEIPTEKVILQTEDFIVVEN